MQIKINQNHDKLKVLSKVLVLHIPVKVFSFYEITGLIYFNQIFWEIFISRYHKNFSINSPFVNLMFKELHLKIFN